MNIKKILIGATAGILMFGNIAAGAFAAAPNWNVTGSWNINVEYLSVLYPETLNLTQAGGNITGGNLNTIPPTSGSAFTVTSGTVNGDLIDIFATQDSSSLIVHLTGTIASDGSMNGAWSDVAPGTRTGTWSSTSGKAIKVDKKDNEKDQCKRLSTFTATDSLYYNGPTSSAPLYGTGAFSFSWDPTTGIVKNGYYNEIVNGVTYYNLVTGGSVVGGVVNLTFNRTNPNVYGFSFTGKLSGKVLTGNLDGPYYFTAAESLNKGEHGNCQNNDKKDNQDNNHGKQGDHDNNDDKWDNQDNHRS